MKFSQQDIIASRRFTSGFFVLRCFYSIEQYYLWNFEKEYATLYDAADIDEYYYRVGELYICLFTEVYDNEVEYG